MLGDSGLGRLQWVFRWVLEKPSRVAEETLVASVGMANLGHHVLALCLFVGFGGLACVGGFSKPPPLLLLVWIRRRPGRLGQNASLLPLSRAKWSGMGL